MGLSFKPLENIFNAVATPVEDVGKAIGDAGSYLAGTVTGNQQAQQNASTAFGNAFAPVANIVQAPLRAGASAAVGGATDIYNLTHHTNLTTPELLQQQPNPFGNALDVYGTNHNTNQNLGKGWTLAGNTIQAAAAGAFKPLETIGERAIAGNVGKNVGESLLAKAGGRIGAGVVTGAGFGGGQALTAPNPTVGSVATGVGEGGTVGGITAGLSLARPVVKALRNTPDVAVDTAAADTPKTVVTLKQAGQAAADTTKLNIPQRQSLLISSEATPGATGVTPSVEAPLSRPVQATPIARANTGIPEVDTVINTAADRYTTRTNFSGNAEDLANQAEGNMATNKRVANALQNTLSKYYTKDELHAANAFLDGEQDPGLTPEAFKLANSLRPLYEQAHEVRTIIDPKVGKLADYSPRILLNTLSSGVRDASGNIAGKLKNLADITNLSSGFSKNRLAGKFISKDDVLYGRPSQLGLIRHQDGSITDKSGKVYKFQDVGKHELEANTNYRYEHNEAKVARFYHADTLGLKVKGEAVQALKADPNRYGLYTEAQIAAGEGPKDYMPVNRVAGLTDAEGNTLYAAKSAAKALNDKLGFQNRVGPIGRVYDAASSVATQFIVLNPLFHGMNQLYQTAIAAGNLPGLGNGWYQLAKGVATVSEDDIRTYLDAGGHIPTYGSEIANLLSKATGGVTKLNSKAMMAIETKLRVGLYKASLEKGMSEAQAIKNIDTFLGDSKAIDPMIRRMTLFAHYFKTMSKALGTQITHPIENAGSLGNAALMAAFTAAASYGYAEMTGNPNAKVRVPGELGLAQEAYDTAHGLAKGEGIQAAGLLTNHINPIGKEAASQVLNKDLYTGQPIGNSVKEKLSHVASNTIAPVQTATKVTEGKRSIPETIANQLGLSTPHARGYEAAPKVSFLNKSNAITAASGDPTGYRQEQAYFKNLDTLKKTFSGGDTATQDALNKYLDRSHDPVTGQAIKNSPADTIENSGALATNDKLRAAVQKFEQSQPSHDPMWDLSPDKLQYLMTYKAQLEGSAERNVLKAEATDPTTGANWIDDLTKAQQDFYNNLPKVPGSKGSEANQATPAYPTFDQQTQNLLAAYNNATPDQRSQLIKDNPGELATAFNAIAQWTNQMRKAQTGKDTPQLNIYPEASPAVQKIIDTYNAIPKGGGSKGGNLFRAQWIKANPDAYAQMQNYLTQTSMYSLIKNAALAQFQGTQASQQLLKDIKNVGQFDIATTKNANGTTSYSVNPTAAFAQSLASNSGFGSSSSSSAFSKFAAKVKASSQARDLEHAAKAAKRIAPKNYAHPKKTKVLIKGNPQLSKKKVSLPGVTKHYTPKIKAKAAPSGNKVKMKV